MHDDAGADQASDGRGWQIGPGVQSGGRTMRARNARKLSGTSTAPTNSSLAPRRGCSTMVAHGTSWADQGDGAAVAGGDDAGRHR
jgi:hypothetical protein